MKAWRVRFTLFHDLFLPLWEKGGEDFLEGFFLGWDRHEKFADT